MLGKTIENGANLPTSSVSANSSNIKSPG